jgi:hypothetical protein
VYLFDESEGLKPTSNLLPFAQWLARQLPEVTSLRCAFTTGRKIAEIGIIRAEKPFLHPEELL